MLESTFRHLPGIGASRERGLWARGVVNWDDYERSARQLSFLVDPPGCTTEPLAESRAALRSGDASYFASRLPKSEHYRIALAFPAETMFLDIETTGLSRVYDVITVVGWSLGPSYDVFVSGDERTRFEEAVASAKVLVTFNGTLFDLPFLRLRWPDLVLPVAQVDLRYLTRRVGLVGGQKKVEFELGMARARGIAGLSGASAPLLWYEYQHGSRRALRRLIRYNHSDVEGMKSILDEALTRLFVQERVPDRVVRRGSFAAARSRLEYFSARAGRAGVTIRKYAGQLGPRAVLGDLGVHESFRVVGIDLTGSEARSSGWSLVAGGVAKTAAIRSDEDLLSATLAAHATLVSIDAPLSLPAGRRDVSDDDPTRLTAGIARLCERELWRRGVSTYPALIKSMQGLTRRGIMLAKHLRSLGVPVIESFPGAAQDILGIPRKGVGLVALYGSLREFGLTIDGSETSLTHDELDAITSALVGLFFWSGRFEALGSDVEDYLIVPNLSVSPKRWRDRVVIGVSGPIAAGKTTVGRMLESGGFAYCRFSEIVAEVAEDRGLDIGRRVLQFIGGRIHEEPGQRWLERKVAKRVGDNQRVVVDGLRFLEDHAFFVERYGPSFLHVHIEASREVRMARYVASGRGAEEFMVADLAAVESEVAALRRVAHLRLCNDGRLEALIPRLRQLGSGSES